ncbi:hypothetical protein [Kitasatospora cinereorecta]|uniref:Uncharacterized protein n=1 Tax=Kitasatospora cinereorecta TaxID=285560 RepID=A0ABW0V6I4_9ACTN
MARLLVDGGEVVVRLTWWERIVTHHRELRVPLAAVARVAVEPVAWRALRGVPEHGLLVPGAVSVGDRRHPAGRDFVAVRLPRRQPVVCVDLRAPAPYRRIAVGDADAERTAERLRAAVAEQGAAERDAPPP